ncbi:hypothetical protein WA538_003854, partial [Blastocystis sp. DL]
ATRCIYTTRYARCYYTRCARIARYARYYYRASRDDGAQRATARCNYSAATLRRKTCVFPFARQREWMCQNYWHRAQRDATTARLRRALTGDSLERTRCARSRHRATARCNYHAAEPRSKTCVFPFARQREWMCQNYWHRAQRDATTARLRRALTGDSLERTRCARSRHRATARCNYHAAEPPRMDVPKLRASRAARCNYSAATPRPHYRFFSANALPRVSTTRGYAATHTRYARHTLASLAHSQEFISTSLFDSSMSALPIIAKQNSPSVGLFTH